MDPKSIFAELGKLLRYVLPSMAGIMFCWCIDKDHDIVFIMGGFDPNSPESGSWWPPFLFLIVAGVSIYVVHKNVVYPLIIGLMYKAFVVPQGIQQDELDVARWIRSYANPESCKEGAIQATLREFNSGGHFLYCCAYAVVLMPAALTHAFNPGFEIQVQWRTVVALGVMLLGLAFLSDIRTTIWDVKITKSFDPSLTLKTGYTIKRGSLAILVLVVLGIVGYLIQRIAT